jgi:hypothetical protein
VPPRRRVPLAEGSAALRSWVEAGGQVERAVLATAVRYALEELSARHPGRSVEVRVPPFGAAQALQGPTHRRGTPPNVVETDAATWLALVTGRLAWSEASAGGLVRDSGTRADLSSHLPLW